MVDDVFKNSKTTFLLLGNSINVKLHTSNISFSIPTYKKSHGKMKVLIWVVILSQFPFICI